MGLKWDVTIGIEIKKPLTRDRERGLLVLIYLF